MHLDLDERQNADREPVKKCSTTHLVEDQQLGGCRDCIVESDVHVRIGALFARQRIRAGLIQEDVAACCHVSRVAVHHWESGRTPAPLVAWRTVAAWDKGLLDAIESGLLCIST